jgi:hypothetical protein
LRLLNEPLGRALILGARDQLRTNIPADGSACDAFFNRFVIEAPVFTCSVAGV